MKYKVVIFYDKEYQGYVVDVPQLNGCMSQGKTIYEALENVKDAIKGWLHVEAMHGRSNINEYEDMRIGEVTV